MPLDDFLMDRVAQPICDRLAERVSCFDMARSAVIGWVVFEAAWGLARTAESELTFLGGACLAVATLLVPLFLLSIREIEKRARRSPGANPERLNGRILRCIGVASVVVCSIMGLIITTSGLAHASSLFGFAAIVCLTASFHLRAVNVLPAKPVKRRAEQLAVAGGRA